jgi:diacylglycerol kinase (ATP)
VDPLLLITNVDAGGGRMEGLDLALSVLREDADVEVAHTENPGELDGVLHRAGCRSIVVAGGDGSLHAVVSALHRRHELADRTLGLIPLGTGNDFARTLGIPLDPGEAAAALLSGTPRRMDLIVDELGGVVVNSVHAGASAQASRRGARWKERLGPYGFGILGYPIGAAMAALRPPFVRLRIEADGEVISDMDQHILMIAVGNGASVGGGTELTPDADPEDGRLDVMVSFATGPIERLAYVWKLRTGDHEDRDDVISVRAQQVTVSGEDFWLAADGEISGPERRRSWHLEKGAYSMVVPAP